MRKTYLVVDKLLDIAAKVLPTSMLDMVNHYIHEFSWLVDHFQRSTSRTLRQRCLWHFQNRLAHAVECHHHKSPYKLTNHPISNSKRALLFHSPLACIRIECLDFYFSRELTPINWGNFMKFINISWFSDKSGLPYLYSHLKRDWSRDFDCFLLVVTFIKPHHFINCKFTRHQYQAITIQECLIGVCTTDA